tara:strand:- start:695 stop:1816 length:1122 start_codon:yes stop_codon:yes gene_type:complete
MFSEQNLISDDNTFKKFIYMCLDENIISIDTEFVRNKTFYPKLCLIQIGTSKGSYAIDPNCITNLSLLKKILKNKNILKVFHSPRQDMEIFFNLFGFLPNNIFDTQIAFSFMCQEFQISYEKLVLKLLKIKLDKTFQYYDWSLRPISQNQLTYALNDVYYLRKIYFKIEQKLKSKNRLHWAIEESKTYLNKKLYLNDPENYWKNIYPSKAKDLNLFNLKKICEWRERKCTSLNVSRKLVLSDKDLIILIKNPKHLNSLNLKYKLEKKDLQIIYEILSNNSETLPKEKPKILKNNIELLNILKIILKLISNELDISHNLIATTSELEKINFKNNKKSRLFKTWRNEVFGIKIKKFLNNELKIIIKKNNLYLEKN